MKVEYPELNTIDQFLNLSNAEMVFVWLMTNRTSPLCQGNEPNRKRATKLALAWSKLDKLLSKKDITDYEEHKFPSKLVNALNKMAAFNPSIRMKAKMISEKMLSNVSRMVDVSEEEFSQMTLDDKKKYSEFTKTVTNTLDELIVANEDAYGVKVVKKKQDAQKNQGQTLMDSILNS
jgi:hypothetical protein